MTEDYVYEYGDGLYFNLTNECPNSCDFCIRNFKDGVNGSKLWLFKEPTFEEIKEEVDKRDLSGYAEGVFCGFGEPTCKLELLIKVASYLKSKGLKTRLNTNGLSDLINGIDNSAELLAPYFDCISISLNEADAEKYDAVCHSVFGKEAYAAMLDFARQCVKQGVHTVMSVVDVIGEDEVKKCAEVVKSTGAEFRVRKLIDKDTKY